MHRRARHFNPRDAGAALALDARFITGLSDGAVVSAWSDRTNNANNATQSTTANKPDYKVNIINGNPVLLYDGVKSQLNLASAITESPNNVRTVISVMKRASGQRLFDISNNTNSVPYGNVPYFSTIYSSSYSITASYSSDPTAAVILSSVGTTDPTIYTYQDGVYKVASISGAGSVNSYNCIGYRYSENSGGYHGSTSFYRASLSNPLRRRIEQAAAFSFKISCS